MTLWEFKWTEKQLLTKDIESVEELNIILASKLTQNANVKLCRAS